MERRTKGRKEERKKGKMGEGGKEKDVSVGVLISPARASKGRERRGGRAGEQAAAQDVISSDLRL